MKKIMLVLMLINLVGCATHAQIVMPVVEKVYDKKLDGKSFSYTILYSQPEPGIFSGGEQQPLQLLSQAEMSVASSATLQKLHDYIYDQLPSSVIRKVTGEGEYKLVVELVAHDKQGPAYAEFRFFKTFMKDLFTFGFASADYYIIADYDVDYKLFHHNEDTPIFSKHYRVKEQVDHQRGDLESFNTLNDFSGQLLEKSLILSLNDFFENSKNAL